MFFSLFVCFFMCVFLCLICSVLFVFNVCTHVHVRVSICGRAISGGGHARFPVLTSWPTRRRDISPYTSEPSSAREVASADEPLSESSTSGTSGTASTPSTVGSLISTLYIITSLAFPRASGADRESACSTGRGLVKECMA